MSRSESGGATSSAKFGGRKRSRQDQGHAKTPLSSTVVNGVTTVVLEDDEDAIIISSPRSVNKAREAASKRSHCSVVNEEDLELQLGPAGTRASSVKRTSGVVQNIQEVAAKVAIDLTDGNDDCQLLFSSSKKRKHVEAFEDAPKQVKLICAICMDAMKEETSTVCGHLFCKGCIVKAIKEQKKCPSCRKKLSNSQIHRVYISGTTS